MAESQKSQQNTKQLMQTQNYSYHVYSILVGNYQISHSVFQWVLQVLGITYVQYEEASGIKFSLRYIDYVCLLAHPGPSKGYKQTQPSDRKVGKFMRAFFPKVWLVFLCRNSQY